MAEEEEQQGEDTNVYRPMDSILTPIFVEMMNNSARNHPGADMDSHLQEILRRRGRRPVSIDQLLQGIYAGLTLAPAETNNAGHEERGRVIVTNPYNQIVAVPSSAVSETLPPVVAGSLSEYFIGPEFEAFLESLTETDPSRYGTPPARRDTVESLANVIIQEPGIECSVCLGDFEVGTVGKQMPCKHRFHPHCLLPWLELHSSCPVCRSQLPTATTEPNGSNGGGVVSASTSSSQGYENSDGNRDEEDEDGDNVESLANVIIQEAGLKCSVCLDDFEVGTVGKQMPCKHRFHSDCLLPWLELHSSCPVCRYQLPSATTETNGSNGGGGVSASTSSSQGSENSDGNRDEDGDRSMLDPMEALATGSQDSSSNT